jgi:DNA replication protein DnaC
MKPSPSPRGVPPVSALPARPMATDLASLAAQLSRLGLEFAAEALPSILTEAVREDLGGPAVLSRLLTREIERREERRLKTSLRHSGLPMGPTVANFDFAFQPSVERSKVETLATCAWVKERQNLLILGPPGVGKTHLGVSLGARAVWILGGFLPVGGIAAGDAARRGGGPGSVASPPLHEQRAGDHR